MKNYTLWFGTIAVVFGALFIFFFIPLRDSFTISSDPVELYYADHISRGHQEIIDRFNREYEGRIRIVPIDLPFSKFSTNELKEMLARSLRSKSERLDIFSVDVIWVPRFAKWAYPLDAYFSDDILEKLHKSALESCYFDGKLVTIPLYIDVGLLYYRRDLLQKLDNSAEIEQKLRNSISWNEFLELGRQWKKTGLPYFIFPSDNYEGFICMVHETISEEQSHRMFEDDSVMLDNGELRRGLGLLHDMIHKWHLTPSAVTDFDETRAVNFALEHDALFVRGWPGYRVQYAGSIAWPEKLRQLGHAPIPHFPGTHRTGVFGGWNLMVSRFSTKKKEAVEFIRFVQQERNQIALHEKSGYIPVLNTIFENDGSNGGSDEISYYRELLEKGRHRPFREDYTQISDILSFFFKQFLKKEITIDEAIDAAAERINEDQAFIY